MSNIAELAVLKRQIEELQDHVKDIDHGLSKKERNLRDEFAMVALSGLVSDPLLGHQYDSPQSYEDGVSERAYELADAMMKARGV